MINAIPAYDLDWFSEWVGKLRLPTYAFPMDLCLNVSASLNGFFPCGFPFKQLLLAESIEDDLFYYFIIKLLFYFPFILNYLFKIEIQFFSSFILVLFILFKLLPRFTTITLLVGRTLVGELEIFFVLSRVILLLFSTKIFFWWSFNLYRVFNSG